ncbi:MAG: hypothetical protein DKM50_12565 [Candidatus Margulisiibacteriota bacterium]|nr:MAG: hypothetical protein A2X43_11025 [Candidatus Margulisbacteria bacterium GWD2_39_127]OGI02761.1 MAG: hypothetical protein A2X42_01850 [Candidatus Margulisbacteria bacterium GWF2_38_17]OGI09352.1 MAG: hypothetical protein A2X41_09525 [Candidatus Margulisbacteria bacterium GWE2_39_32]PZM77434.1 MAG: hypothetical protein DKM50_12565 [Candidatus Margulisiibacteriota bacterium]HAR64003.1 hypothetical protein [Candidatus Margulisiibacteriota bacterium]
MTLHAIILAAGKGTRMKSKKVKTIHDVAGIPVINKVINNLEELNISSMCIVVGFQSDDVLKTVTSTKVEFVTQKEQLGTGHAVIQTEENFKNKEGDIIILPGDAPLISAKTLNDFYLYHKKTDAHISVLSTSMPDPTGYGRIIRDKSDQVLKIVEQKDATEDERLVKEINTGIYCVSKSVLFQSLKSITTDNKQKEYYLTDIIQIAKNNGQSVYSYVANNYREFQGINSRKDLSDVSLYLYQLKNELLMNNGVTIIDPNTTYIEHNAIIDQDTIIYPGVYIKGHSIIGNNCVIGSNTYIENGIVPDNTVILPNQNIIA